MKITTLFFGIASAVLWFTAAFVWLPVGVGADQIRRQAERKIGWLNAAAAAASALTSICGAFSN